MNLKIRQKQTRMPLFPSKMLTRYVVYQKGENVLGVCVDKFVQKLSFKKVKKITKYVVVVVCLGDGDDGGAMSFLSDMHLGANVFKSKSKIG